MTSNKNISGERQAVAILFQRLLRNRADSIVIGAISSKLAIYRMNLKGCEIKRFAIAGERALRLPRPRLKFTRRRSRNLIAARDSRKTYSSLLVIGRSAEMTFFVETLQKPGHPIATLGRAAKENYVETGAVTLGALYCCARLRLSGE